MLRLSALWVLCLLMFGCTRAALPSTAQLPAPVASAAQPGVTGRGDLQYARRAAEALRHAIREMEPDEALARVPSEGIKVPTANVSAACVPAPGGTAILVCQFGPPSGQPVAQALLWHDGGGWRAQMYPDAPPRLAAERRKAMEAFECRIGCYSGISQARQSAGPLGPELLVVVDLGLAGAEKAEEVQLLRLSGDGEWEVAWVPGDGDWNYGHAEVRLPARGFSTFQVSSTSASRQDRLAGYLSDTASQEFRRFAERWERQDAAFIMRDKAELPSPYGTLVRLIYYLSNGADEKAHSLLKSGVSLDEARQVLAQKPQRQGWTVVRWGNSGFLLDTARSGKPTVGVRFEQEGTNWILAEVWRLQAQQ